jgi:hypothetical protein
MSESYDTGLDDGDQDSPEPAPAEQIPPTESGAMPRRSLIGGLALGGAALGAGVVGGLGSDRLVGASGFRKEEFTLEVACLGPTMREAVAKDTGNPQDSRAPFIVEGWIFPEGTIRGDGFIPTEDKSIGRWFCRGWILVNGDRDQPHTINNQDFILGTMSIDRLFPPDTMSVAGLEGTEFRDQVAFRSVVGGTGKYMGAIGQATERLFALNSTTFAGSDTDFAPCFRFVFDIRVLD